MKKGDLAIRLDGVGLAFPMAQSALGSKYWALEHIDLELKHGDKLGVIGRNGAGKSTLLRVLAGSMVPDRGTLLRNHDSIQLLSLGVGFVPHLTGRDNAILSALLQGFNRREIESRLDAVKDFSGLGTFFEEPIHTYSSGMNSRLGFALAMQFEPQILLLDETLSVGDAEFNRKSKEALMRRFQDDHTIVLVSHSEAVVSSLCTTALWVENGRTVMSGPVDEVLEAYREQGVAASSGAVRG